MTKSEWQSTMRVTDDFDWAKDVFGNCDEDTSDWAHVLEYESGIIVKLKDGRFYSVIGNTDYTSNSLSVVENHLWHDFASHEVY
jgi:hypothetical protein